MKQTTAAQDKKIAKCLSENLSFSIFGRELSVDDGDMSFLLGLVEGEFEPDDVFQYDVLSEWAILNGFVREAN